MTKNEEKNSQLRRDAHHGGWTLITYQPEREQLLAIPHEQWPKSGTNALSNPEAAGAAVIASYSTPLPDGGQHTVKVIANRFALYRVEGQEDREGIGMYDLMRGVGAHEIIIESDRHDDSLLTMNPYQYALTLKAIQDRIRDLKKDSRLHCFSVFREWCCGPDNSSVHPHSQLIANAIVPLGLKNELDEARKHYDYKERCLFCDMIRQEKNDRERLVNVTDEYMTFCPFASRNPFEIHLFPKKHLYDFTDEPEDRLTDLAAIIQDTAMRLEKAVPGWRILLTLHTAPVLERSRYFTRTLSHDFHWHFEFLPHPPGWIDWYSRTGTHVECTPPENAAAFLRDLKIPAHWE